MKDGFAITAAPPLSPERLRALAAEAWPLLPVPSHERKGLLRDEAAMLVDGLLVEVARSSGAIDVGIGEGLAALCSGDGPMRLGYSGIGDYARENLSMAPRTAFELAKLSRELRSRPLLREAVRTGAVSVKQAGAVLKVAVGEAEAGWVARAKHQTVAELRAAVRGSDTLEEKEKWDRYALSLEPPERAEVDEALELAGKAIGNVVAPRWQRAQAIYQEYLGEHPAPERKKPADEFPPWWKEALEQFAGPDRPPVDLRLWLAQEHKRWSFLRRLDPIAAPEVGVDDLTRARKIDARLRELSAMRKGWDELVGHLSLLIVNTGLWRDMQFESVDHYATERLGLSGRAMEQRAWLERRMWELPKIRQAMRASRIGYEKARLVARCPDEAFVEAWISMAEGMTCIALQRAIEKDSERQMCARGKLPLLLPEEVSNLFREARRAVEAAEGRYVRSAEAFLIMCRHFTAVWKEALNGKMTRSQRVRERDGGWCTVPGCSRPAAHAHHIQYRSHGGGDEDENLHSTCLAHHLHGIHKRYIRLRGRAPDRLVWELGEVE